MRCNTLNIKTVAKQVQFYFICTTLRLGYIGNLYLKIKLPKNKYLPNFSYPTKNPKSKFSKPQKILQSCLSLEIWCTPTGCVTGQVVRTLSSCAILMLIAASWSKGKINLSFWLQSRLVKLVKGLLPTFPINKLLKIKSWYLHCGPSVINFFTFSTCIFLEQKLFISSQTKNEV